MTISWNEMFLELRLCDPAAPNFLPMNLSLGMHELDKNVSKKFILADTTQ
jgi:hypothetical protein